MDPNDDLILNSMALMPPQYTSARLKNRPKRVWAHQGLWLSQKLSARVIDPVITEEVDEMFDPPQPEGNENAQI